MHNTSFFMQILQSVGHLRDDVTCQVFAKVRKTDDLMEELAAGAQLQDDIIVLAGFGEVDEADNVGVVELPHDLNLFQDVGAL